MEAVSRAWTPRAPCWSIVWCSGCGGRAGRCSSRDSTRAARPCWTWWRSGWPSRRKRLGQQGPPPRPTGLERLGRLVVEGGREGFALLSFCGEACLAFVQSLLHPGRFRWRYVLSVLEHDGVRSIPVLGMLSFLLGVVIAYQAGVQFRVYGGNLYVVDLVGITVLRELGPLMTAIVVAGRSGSAYTAQIGTMQVTEEVDALRSIGVSPLDLLVLPKILGLVIALPLLTVFADVAAVGGGMAMSALMLDVEPRGLHSPLSGGGVDQFAAHGGGQGPGVCRGDRHGGLLPGVPGARRRR